MDPDELEFSIRVLAELRHRLEEMEAEIQLAKLRAQELRQSVLNFERSLKFESKEWSLVPTESHMFCLGQDRASRHCRVQNLCYDAKDERLFVLKSSKSKWINVPEANEADEDRPIFREFLDETTQRDHNLYYLDLGIEEGSFFLDNYCERLDIRVYDEGLVPSLESATVSPESIRLTIVKEPTLFVKRFYPFNVHHNLHDDLYGYAAQWRFWNLTATNSRLIIYDHGHANAHDQMYDWLGVKMQRIEDIMGWPHWVSDTKKRRKEFVCFKEAIIGTTKDNTWYQYGYTEPQGPIPGHTATGWAIREITQGILTTVLKQGAWNTAVAKSYLESLITGGRITEEHKKELTIGIFSRTLNRLILNEMELATSLEKSFGLPVVFLRMEDMSVNTIARHLRCTIIAYGMHGSLLSMGSFMPPGSILIEGYPYGVPAENYTPYRTMCSLPGMCMVYRAWTCPRMEDVVGHPERSAANGGIRHLPEEEQKAILESTTIKPHLCCADPYWLYRIYQDTKVDVPEVINLITESLPEALAYLK